MKCPKCGRDMEQGFLQSDAKIGINWVSKLMPFGVGWWKKDAVYVSVKEGAGVVGVPAYICKQCKLLLGDYNETE